MRFRLRRSILWLLAVACTVVAFSGGAWAQGMSAGILPGIINLIGGADALAGFLLPPVLALIMQGKWSWQFKANVAWVACLIAAVGIAAAQGHFNSLDWQSAQAVTAKFGVILTIAKNSFDGFWKPTNIAPKIEAATDIESAPAPAAKTAVVPPPPARQQTPMTNVEQVQEIVRKELLTIGAKPPAAAPIVAGVPIAPDADFSDVEDTGVVLPPEEAPQALLGTIDWDAAKPAQGA